MTLREAIKLIEDHLEAILTHQVLPSEKGLLLTALALIQFHLEHEQEPSC